MQLSQGLLIAVEGIDGSGKSTLAKAMVQKLTELQFNAILTKEPGGTSFGLPLREILQNAQIKRCSRAEFLLYAADRAQHFQELVLPALAQQAIVVSDRMNDSSLVYQGYGRGLSLETITTINQWAMQGREPDLVLYVTIDIETAWQRILQRNEALTAFEQEKKDFFERLIQGFEEIYRNRTNIIHLHGKLAPAQLLTTAMDQLIPWINNFTTSKQSQAELI